jgi:hypothetical protein
MRYSPTDLRPRRFAHARARARIGAVIETSGRSRWGTANREVNALYLTAIMEDRYRICWFEPDRALGRDAADGAVGAQGMFGSTRWRLSC